jgi:hypothetical protein
MMIERHRSKLPYRFPVVKLECPAFSLHPDREEQCHQVSPMSEFAQHERAFHDLPHCSLGSADPQQQPGCSPGLTAPWDLFPNCLRCMRLAAWGIMEARKLHGRAHVREEFSLRSFTGVKGHPPGVGRPASLHPTYIVPRGTRMPWWVVRCVSGLRGWPPTGTGTVQGRQPSHADTFFLVTACKESDLGSNAASSTFLATTDGPGSPMGVIVEHGPDSLAPSSGPWWMQHFPTPCAGAASLEPA